MSRNGIFRRNHRLPAVLAMLSLAFAVLAVWAPPAGAEEKTISVTTAGGYSPKALDITTGTTVVWHNQDLFDYPVIRGAHQVVALDGSWSSPEIAPGQRWNKQFLDPGTFAYRCSLHPDVMTGEVRVSGEPVKPEETEKSVDIVEPSSSDVETWGYDPKDITVEAGTKVIWRNNGSQVHTVTADDGSFDSGDMGAGDKFEFTFEKSASIRYRCTPHPWMEGIVRVTVGGKAPPPPAPAPKAPTSGGQTPPAVQVPRSGTGPQTWQVKIVEPQPTPTSWGYAPKTLSARVGDTVVFENTGASPHTATASDKSFDSGMLNQGQKFTWKPTKTGTFSFSCTPHPWMKGVVRVAAAGSTAELPPAPEEPATDPAVQPGAGEHVGEGEHAGAADPDAGSRNLMAILTSIVASLLAFGMIAPTLVERRRRRDGTPPGGHREIVLDDHPQEVEAGERSLVGAGAH